MVRRETLMCLPRSSLWPPRRPLHSTTTVVCLAGWDFRLPWYQIITLAFFIRVLPESQDDEDEDEEGPGLTKKKKKAKTGKRGARKRAEAEAKAAEGGGGATAGEKGAAPSQEALFKKANDAKNEVKLKEALEVQRQDRMAQVTTSSRKVVFN